MKASKRIKQKWMTRAFTMSMAALMAVGTCGCGFPKVISGIKNVVDVVNSQGGEKESGGSDNEVNPTETGESNEVGESNEAENSPENQVVASVFPYFEKEGTYTIVYDEENSYEYEYAFCLPEIQADTEGAKKINEEIKEIYNNMVDYVNSHENGAEISADDTFYDTFWISNVSYEWYQTNDVISIVIKNSAYFEDYVTYVIYNYDIKNGISLENDALLEKAGYTKEQFLEEMKRAAAYASDEQMAYYFDWQSESESEYYEDDVQSMYVMLLRMRSLTISSDRVNMNIPMYMDETGTLKAVVNLEVAAGSGTIPVILEPVKASTKQMSDQFMDSVFVEGNEKEITIQFKDTQWEQRCFSNTAIETGKSYTIHGALKNYVDCKFALTGNMIVPYLVLLSDDGMISYVDLEACARADYFCVTEPMMGCTNVKALEYDAYDGEDMEIQGVFLIKEDESKIGISDLLYTTVCLRYDGFGRECLNLYEQEGYNASCYHTVATGGGYESNYYLGFDFEYPSRFLFQEYLPDVDLSMRYEGYLNYLGMDEEGLIVELYLDELNDEMIEEADYINGVYRFVKHPSWNAELEYFDDSATMLWLSGTDLFDSGKEAVVLNVSCG